MRRLSKEQRKRKDDLVKAMAAQEDAYSTALCVYNERVAEAFAEVERERGEYDGAQANIRDFMQELAADMEAYQDEKSDAWREGEAGERYEEWRQRWEDEIGEPEELEAPPSLDEPSETVSSVFDDLPDEPEGC